MKHTKAGYRNSKAFTLIELLVVVSTIVLLLSILTPCLAEIQKQGSTDICVARLKDIGNKLGMYVNDFDNKLPPSYITSPEEAQQTSIGKFDPLWIARLAHYYGKTDYTPAQGFSGSVFNMETFRCPTQEYYLQLLRENAPNIGGYSTMVTSPITGRQIGLWSGAGTYGYNVFFSGLYAYNMITGTPTGENTYNYRRADSIKNPSTLPMVADLAAEPFYGYQGAPYPPPSQASNLGGWLLWPQNPHPIAQNYGWEGGWWSYGPAAVHDDGKINYLFADGHVESRIMWPWDNVDYYEGQWDRIQYFHPEGKGLY